MCYLTGASILAFSESIQYLALACNYHLSVEWDSVQFGAGNPKLWVDDYNRKVLNFPAMGGCASLAQRGPKRDAK